MASLKQLSGARVVRGRKKHYNVSSALKARPHLRAVCLKVYTTKPKKPNSAIRKIAKVRLSTGRRLIAYNQVRGITCKNIPSF